MPTALPTRDEPHMGVEVAFGQTLIGHVEAVVQDPISRRIRYVIIAYGDGAVRRRVAVPMEWVLHQTTQRLTLGVGSKSLDDLPEAVEALHLRVN